jgi:hypothetical protein
MPIRPGKPHSKKFVQQVEATLPEGVQPGQADIWFQDEMRIGQRGTQTRLWARKGTRPRVVRQQQSGLVRKLFVGSLELQYLTAPCCETAGA